MPQGPSPAFFRPSAAPPVTLTGDHGGVGSIAFRRILDHDAFASAIDFVDVSVIPPGSTIGRHDHRGNEELYYIVAGSPLMTVDGQTQRLQRGDLTLVRSGGWHQLVNDGAEPVEILVVQASL